MVGFTESTILVSACTLFCVHTTNKDCLLLLLVPGCFYVSARVRERILKFVEIQERCHVNGMCVFVTMMTLIVAFS